MFCRGRGLKQGQQPSYLILKKKSEEPPVDPKIAEDDAVHCDDPQPEHSFHQ
jgi:hypothetical protein